MASKIIKNYNTITYFWAGLLIITLLLSITINANTIKPFKSDGCSLFPEGSPKQNMLWKKCCVKHDYAYWKGGSFWQRIEADRQLKVCVKSTGKHKTALLMQAAVRLGGTPFLPTPFRWGYGWKYPRFYKKLTPNEIQKINSIQAQSTLLLSPTSSP